MNQNGFSSKLLDNALEAFGTLPGIGRKTALRLVLHLLGQTEEQVDGFVEAISKLRHEVKYCSVCHNISDEDICDICKDSLRDHSLICVVQNVQDVMAVENTQQFRGLYHVLGGIISPMDGIGPSDLNIDQLVNRVKTGNVREVILALSSTSEGETTNFYITRKLAAYPVKITSIARGVAVGEELEYADEITLGRSILERVHINRENM